MGAGPFKGTIMPPITLDELENCTPEELRQLSVMINDEEQRRKDQEVAERKKEIGIRMALGAKRAMILNQFLIESVLLCLVGGFIGMLFGISIPYIVAYFTKWNPIVTMSSILVSLFTASAVGIFFGFYPARKAANLNPVDALMER